MNSDPLAQLRDIHTAAGAPWWPPAPGWWVLFVLLLLLLVVIARRLKTHRETKRRKRQMLSWIDNLNVLVDPVEQPQAYLSGLNRIFKVVALKAFPSENCAALSGSAWVAFLHQKLADQSSTEALTALASGPFDPHPQFDAEALCELGRDWIKRYG